MKLTLIMVLAIALGAANAQQQIDSGRSEELNGQYDQNIGEDIACGAAFGPEIRTNIFSIDQQFYLGARMQALDLEINSTYDVDRVTFRLDCMFDGVNPVSFTDCVDDGEVLVYEPEDTGEVFNDCPTRVRCFQDADPNVVVCHGFTTTPGVGGIQFVPISLESNEACSLLLPVRIASMSFDATPERIEGGISIVGRCNIAGSVSIRTTYGLDLEDECPVTTTQDFRGVTDWPLARDGWLGIERR